MSGSCFSCCCFAVQGKGPGPIRNGDSGFGWRSNVRRHRPAAEWHYCCHDFPDFAGRGALVQVQACWERHIAVPPAVLAPEYSSRTIIQNSFYSSRTSRIIQHCISICYVYPLSFLFVSADLRCLVPLGTCGHICAKSMEEERLSVSNLLVLQNLVTRTRSKKAY